MSEVTNFSKDFQDGLVLLHIAKAIGGISYAYCKNPQNHSQYIRNNSIALISLFKTFDDLNVDIVAEGFYLFSLYCSTKFSPITQFSKDIVSGNVDKIKALLDAISSDEWVVHDKSAKAFDPSTCNFESVHHNFFLFFLI